MSREAFGTILKIAGIAALVAVALPFGAAILAGAAIGTIGLTAFGTALLASGLLAINVGNALSQGRPMITAQDIAGRLNISQDPNAFRDVLIGTTATAGVLRYKNLIEGTDDEPDILWLVVVLAGYPCDGLDSFIFNGETITVNSDGTTEGAFAGKLFVYFRKGDETDHAFPALVDGTWDAKARRGRGLCCAAIKVINDEVFEGKVEPVFVIRGAKLFDPRQDTAWGGSGSHDFGDDTTFEHSDNPSEAKLTFLRGFYIQDSGANDVLIAGRGLKDKETTRFDFANWIASANTDEDQIPVVGGGNIDRYTANGIIQVSRSPADTIKILDAAQAGTTVFSGGKYRSYPGIYRAPTLTFGEADIIGVPKRLDIRRGQDSIVNVVSGSFASADDRFELRDYPRQKDAASITRVGEMQQDLNLPFTTDHRMAQRIALISMRQANAQRSFTATFSHRALRLAPGGENVTVNYPHFDFVSEVMRVTKWALIPSEDKKGMPGLTVDMTLVQDLSSFYSWTAASDEQSIVTPGQMPGAIGPGARTVQRNNAFNERQTYIKFDGSVNGSRLEVADISAFDFGAADAGTWEMEVYLDDFSAIQAMLDKGFTGVAAGFGIRILTDGTFQVGVADGTTQTTLAHQTKMEVKRWHHLAWKRTAAGVITSYLDLAVSSGTITENDSMANSAPLQFFARASTVEEGTGRQRNIRKWDHARTLQELIDNRRKILVGDEPGLIGFWPFREGSGKTTVNLGSTAGGDASFITDGPSWGGVVGEGLPMVEAALDDFGNLKTDVGIDQGDGVIRVLSEGLNFVLARDGDSFVFDPARATIPSIVPGPGGLARLAALTGDLFYDFAAINLTTGGFDARLEISETVGGLTLRTDSPSSAGPGDPDRVINKALAAEAWDDKYNYLYDITIAGGDRPRGFAKIYTNDGGGWVLRLTVIYNGNQTTSGEVKTVTVDGLGLDDDYGMSFTGDASGTFTNVTYNEATAPTTTPGTTASTGPVPLFILGGEEGSVS